jgi:hypothetical protein
VHGPEHGAVGWVYWEGELVRWALFAQLEHSAGGAGAEPEVHRQNAQAGLNLVGCRRIVRAGALEELGGGWALAIPPLG